jgi:hypothetical protein
MKEQYAYTTASAFPARDLVLDKNKIQEDRQCTYNVK